MLDLEDPKTLRAILTNLGAGLYITNRERRIVFWNRSAEQLTGYMQHNLLGHICVEDAAAVAENRRCPFCGTIRVPDEVLNDGTSNDTHVYLEHKAGHMIPVHVRAVAIRDTHGIAGVFRTFEEQQTTALPSLASLAAHDCLDSLSGVPNHRFTEFHLRESLLSLAQCSLPFGILCIAAGNLEHIREAYGHKATTAMLHMVAQTAFHVLGPSAFLGRWGDNEFIAIIAGCDRAELEKRAGDVRQIVGKSHITWWDGRISPKVVVTETMAQLGDTLETLLERAEREFRPDARSVSEGTSLEEPGDAPRKA